MNHRLFRSALRGAAGLSILACLGATAARAEEPVQAQSGAGNEATTIVVTGSRIRQPNLVNIEPTVTTTQQYIRDRGLTNVADALNETPGYRGSVTPKGAQANFGQGVNFVNAFGVGSNRTLTLVNGRRVVTSNVPAIFNNATYGTQVDLNVIPTILVERVDRVAIGGAPVYGTDAIAGTVNVILKQNFEGLDLRANTGVTSRGDNFRYTLSGAWGLNFDGGRGNITVSAMTEHVEGVHKNARGFYRDNLGFATNLNASGKTPATDGRVNPNIGYDAGSADGNPGSVLIHDLRIPFVTAGGLIASGPGLFQYQFDGSGNLVPFNKGSTWPSVFASGGDGLSLNDYDQVTSTTRRKSANVLAHYEFSDAARLFVEGMVYDARADEVAQQPIFNSPLFSGASGGLVFRLDNPFLTSQAKALLQSKGYTTVFGLSRANADLADTSGYSTSRLYRIVTGMDGRFEIGGRTYNYEVSSTYGRNVFKDYGQNINQQHFVNAINVAKVGDTIVCSTTQTVLGTPTGPVADAACKPLNLFGNGVASKEAIDYVVQRTVGRSVMEQWVLNANMGGSPFDVFGNPASFNIGFEHHAEKARFTPDAFLQAGLGRSPAVLPTAGKYNLDEVFGEVYLPLISPANDFVFRRFDVFARGRHVDNTVNGSFFSWSAGGRFAPIDDIEFRGNFTRSFRAPSVIELFAPVSDIRTAVPDLCSIANINAGPVPTIRHANCTAFLAKYPTATPLLAAAATVPGRSGGNAGLRNEKADSFTYGVIVQPRVLPGFSLAVDYLNIHITDPVTSLDAKTIASACFDNPDFNASDPANGNRFCSLLRRDATGQIPNDPANPAVNTTFVNGIESKFSGVQASLDYRTATDRIGIPGALALGVDLFHVRRRLVNTTGVAPARSDGTVGDPAWQAQARLRFAQERWGLYTGVNYTGKQLTSRFNRGGSPNDTREIDHLKAYATVDASLWFETANHFRMTLSATNLFDRVGQKYYGVLIPSSIVDDLGRRFSLTVEKTF